MLRQLSCSLAKHITMAEGLAGARKSSWGRSDNLGQWLGEGGTWKGPMATNETPDMQMQRHRHARPGQIGDGALIQAVDVI